MAALEKRALEQALTILKSLEARFRVEMPSGEVYGELVAVPPQERNGKRRGSVFPLGSLKRQYLPYVEALAPGEKAIIPCAHYGKQLANSLTAWASGAWGRGSYLTHYDKEENTISIMRTI